MRPKILAFCCQYCGYAGADLAGVSRTGYPPNVLISRVPCSGRVSPLHVLEAFKAGYDGVLIIGCHPGDCHFVSGNELCEKRVEMFKEVLERVGFDSSRLRLEWVSASEGNRFAEVVRDFAEKLGGMGD